MILAPKTNPHASSVTSSGGIHLLRCQLRLGSHQGKEGGVCVCVSWGRGVMSTQPLEDSRGRFLFH